MLKLLCTLIMTVRLIEKLNGLKQYLPIATENLLNVHDQKLADRLRSDINKFLARGVVLVRCYYCKQPLYLRRHQKEGHKYLFCHFKTDDPVEQQCIQRSEMDRKIPADALRAMKYDGARESELHFTLKNIIYDLLHKDKDIGNDTVKKEQRLDAGSEWKRPDV